MQTNSNKKQHRKSIRLREYDYSQPGAYFVTICTQDKKCLFGEIMDGKMILNEFGKIAHKEWENTKNIRKNCHIHESIIMPNHIHGIIEIIFKKIKQLINLFYLKKFSFFNHIFIF